MLAIDGIVRLLARLLVRLGVVLRPSPSLLVVVTIVAVVFSHGLKGVRLSL